MQVEIWSDVVCPWCAIGKRRFETALAGFEHRDEVEVRYRSFELDPTTPRTGEGNATQRLADKYGVPLAQAEARCSSGSSTGPGGRGPGVPIRSRPPGQHRGRAPAAAPGRRPRSAGGAQGAADARLLLRGSHDRRGRHSRRAGRRRRPGRIRGPLGAGVGQVPGRGARGPSHAQALGISGVPFFVLDRTYGVSGAQPAEVLLGALRQAHAAANPLTMVTDPADGDACTDDSCAV